MIMETAAEDMILEGYFCANLISFSFEELSMACVHLYFSSLSFSISFASLYSASIQLQAAFSFLHSWLFILFIRPFYTRSIIILNIRSFSYFISFIIFPCISEFISINAFNINSKLIIFSLYGLTVSHLNPNLSPFTFLLRMICRVLRKRQIQRRKNLQRRLNIGHHREFLQWEKLRSDRVKVSNFASLKLNKLTRLSKPLCSFTCMC